MLASVAIAKTERMPRTMKTMRVWAFATRSSQGRSAAVIPGTMSAANTLIPQRCHAGGHGAGVAAERDGDHGGDDGVGAIGQPGDDAREMPVAESLGDIFEYSSCRWIASTEFGEGITLQPRDPAGEQERDPDRRTCNLTGRTQEGEDARTYHRADADESGLPHRQVLLRRCGTGRRSRPSALCPPSPAHLVSGRYQR